ncbi:5-deoxy-glucuronate isomerase [Streptomyces sp. NPDC001617]
MSKLHIPQGVTADADHALDIDPERAGWSFCGLRIVEPAERGTHTFTTGDSEWIVLPPEGGCTVQIGTEGTTDGFQLLGRESVFASATGFAYAPRDARVQIASGAGGRFALAGAKCERRLPARYGPAPEVPDARPLRPRHVPRHVPSGSAAGSRRGRHWLWRAGCVRRRAGLGGAQGPVTGPRTSSDQRPCETVSSGRRAGFVPSRLSPGDDNRKPSDSPTCRPEHAGVRHAGRRDTRGSRAVQEWWICFHPAHVQGTGGYR